MKTFKINDKVRVIPLEEAAEILYKNSIDRNLTPESAKEYLVALKYEGFLDKEFEVKSESKSEREIMYVIESIDKISIDISCYFIEKIKEQGQMEFEF